MRVVEPSVDELREPLVVPLNVQNRHTSEEWSRIRRVISVRETRQGWQLRPRSRYVGSIRVGDRLLYVPPRFPASTFLGMILIAEGLDAAVDKEVLATAESRARTDVIFQVLSALLIVEAERIAAGHMAQGYARERDRLSTIRGRPVFAPQRPRPPDGRILCAYWSKSTDIALNRAVVAGLAAANKWLPDAPWSRRCRTQRFVWASVAQEAPPTVGVFSQARRSLSRLTAHYGSAVGLAEILLFGWDPDSIQVPGRRDLPAPMFDLAALFESLVERLVRLLVRPHGLRVRPQVTHRTAIRDMTGATYRRIRPDLLITDKSSPVGVIDAKYKPQYLSGGPGLSTGARVSREDLFQLFFYGERLRRQAAGERSLPAFIAAPLLPGETPPAVARRRITWSPQSQLADQIQLTVVAVDVVAATAAVINESPEEAAAASPELDAALGGLARSVE